MHIMRCASQSARVPESQQQLPAPVSRPELSRGRESLAVTTGSIVFEKASSDLALVAFALFALWLRQRFHTLEQSKHSSPHHETAEMHDCRLRLSRMSYRAKPVNAERCRCARTGLRQEANGLTHKLKHMYEAYCLSRSGPNGEAQYT